MRIDELVMERYGGFELKRLELDRSPFTIVFGFNEAGKSTCLAAIGDFLFRIRERHQVTSRFGSDVARIHATITTADGRRLKLRRRCGRGKTLLDEDGAPCGDEILSGLLGSTTRDRFENLFGLDHETLRAGGEALLSPDGDIGRLIVEAGGGLRSLVARLTALDAEIDGLFAPRRKESRAFYQSLAAFEQSQKAARSAMLTHEVWERDRAAHEAATLSLAKAKIARRDITVQLSRLGRIERTLPHLRTLADLEAEIATCSDVADLDTTLPERCDEAFAEVRRCAEATSSAQARLLEVTSRRDAMAVDAALAERDAELRDVASRTEAVVKARTSRENRLVELAEAEGRLAALRRMLGIGPHVDLAPRMPDEAALEAARALIGERAVLATTFEARVEAAGAAEDAAAACRGRVAALAGKGRDEPFGATAASFGLIVSQRAAAERKLAEAVAAADAVRRRAEAAGLPEPTALRDLPWPDVERLRAELKLRDATFTERARHAAALSEAHRQKAAAMAAVTAIGRDGPPTSREIVIRARADRDAVWAEIRAAHVSGRPDATAEHREVEARGLDDAIGAADSLADRFAAEAERTAAQAEAHRRSDEAGAAMLAAEAAIAEIERSTGAQLQAFREAFPAAFGLRSDPNALLELTAVRAEILLGAGAAGDAAAAGRAEMHALEATMGQLEAAERKTGRSARSGESLAARVQAVTAAISLHESEHADLLRERRELVLLEGKARDAARAAESARRNWEAWRSGWTAALAKLGLEAGTEVAEADALVTSWTGAAGYLNSVALTRRRLERMAEEEAELGAAARRLAEALGVVAPSDPVACGAMLTELGASNRETRTRQQALTPEVASAERIVGVCMEAASDADAKLDVLRREAGVDDDAGLKRVVGRRRELETLLQRRAEAVSATRAAGDGLSVEDLRNQAEGADPDGVRAAIAEERERLARVEAEAEEAIRAETASAAAVAAHGERAGAARSVAERETATAGMHEAAERFIELTLARSLVEGAIQAVRSEQQDPLVRSAGTLFASLTDGEFAGIETDVDAKGLPTVVGIRGGGRGRQSVPTMSDGTRDQLYLAFRLASLAEYGAAAEPIPLIADDALVHFDDPRSRATLELLANFSAATQVVLFTHHESVRDAGRRLAAQGRAAVFELA